MDQANSGHVICGSGDGASIDDDASNRGDNVDNNDDNSDGDSTGPERRCC